MTDTELGFLNLIGYTISGIWNALSEIVIFGMPFNMVLTSALLMSTLLPFFIKFLSSGTGFVHSKAESVYHNYKKEKISKEREAKRVKSRGK